MNKKIDKKDIIAKFGYKTFNKSTMENPDLRAGTIRDLIDCYGITEAEASKIIDDLVGFVQIFYHKDYDEKNKTVKSCDSCKSKRIVSIYAHTADSFNMDVAGYENADGYPPFNMGIGDTGDDVEFDYCLECGKIQGKFPISEKTVKRVMKETYDI